ncbi:hypothetical protein BKA81DRAFT_382945 [Phyllosticta paracitricarpa]
MSGVWCNNTKQDSHDQRGSNSRPAYGVGTYSPGYGSIWTPVVTTNRSSVLTQYFVRSRDHRAWIVSTGFRWEAESALARDVQTVGLLGAQSTHPSRFHCVKSASPWDITRFDSGSAPPPVNPMHIRVVGCVSIHQMSEREGWAETRACRCRAACMGLRLIFGATASRQAQ